MALLHNIYSGMASVPAASYLAHVVEHDKDKLRIAALKVLAEMAYTQADNAEYLASVIKRYVRLLPFGGCLLGDVMW